MKNLLIFYDSEKAFKTELEDVPKPTLAANEVLIKVTVAASNPKDFKHPLPGYFNNKLNQGDDCAGIVDAIGSAVHLFKPGDRVAGFHEMDTQNGTYAEYAVCPEHTVFHLPNGLGDEEAATIPLTAFTASVGMYRNLRLPMPFERSDEKAAGEKKIPLIVNAASSAVGSFAIKLAKLNPAISPIIGVAGSSSDYVKAIGADKVVKYNSTTISKDLKAALRGEKCYHVFDASNSLASIGYLTSVLSNDTKQGRYTCTMPVGASIYGKGEMGAALQEAGVWYEQIWVGSVHEAKGRSDPFWEQD